jgi:hypothetical protein
MTRFLLSHNLQVVSDNLKGLNSAELAAGLVAHLSTDVRVQAVSHPHWLVQVEADLLPLDLANAVLLAWRQLRCSAGATDNDCQLLALGGRKDDQGASGALLQQSDWGVDVVETLNTAAFLQSINWDLLKQGRAPDGVFELQG